MITNFTEQTQPLSDDEKALVIVIMKNMKKYTKAHPIKEPQIVAGMRNSGHKKFNGALLRKLINHIRGTSQAPIIATSRGYYWDENQYEIEQQIKSMRDRIKAIAYGADGLETYLRIRQAQRISPQEEPELFEHKRY